MEVEDLAVVVLDDDLRMAFALVLDDDQLACAGRPCFSSSTRTVSPSSMSSKRTMPAFSARIGVRCGSHTTSCWPALTFSPSLDQDRRAVGNLVLLELAALVVHDGDFAVALQGDQALVAFGVVDLALR